MIPIPIPISILRIDTKINFNGYHEFFKKRDILSISFTGLSSRHSDRLNSGLNTYMYTKYSVSQANLKIERIWFWWNIIISFSVSFYVNGCFPQKLLEWKKNNVILWQSLVWLFIIVLYILVLALNKIWPGLNSYDSDRLQ